MTENPEDKTSQAEMPFLEHLTELRTRLIRCIVAVLAGFGISIAFAEQIFGFISKPLIDALPEASDGMVFTNLPEVFFVYIKVALFSGILLALPYIFAELWGFVAPALYKNEKRIAIPFVLFSTLFFLGGAAFGYYQIFPWGFRFFLGFTSDTIVPMITIRDYLKFSTRILLAFGAVFELPVIISFLAKIGLVTPKFLRKQRKYALLIIVVLAAVLTPPDVVTQLMMAAPMYFLYEVSIIAASVFGKRPKS